MPKPKPAPAWIRYRPDHPLLQLLTVSAAAELAHRRFCDYHWSTGLWPQAPPADGPALARCSARGWAALLKELRRLGWRQRGSRLTCAAVAAVRADAVRACLAFRTGGRRGGEARWTSQATLPATLPTTLQGSLLATLPATPSQIQIQIQIQNEKQDVALQAATVTCSPAAQSRRTAAEREFRQEVGELFEKWRKGSGHKELTNWGGWWRNRYRENPDKARRVLAEIRSMVRERKVLGSPGAAAFDLWARLP